jgi:hypothetical protein
LHAIAALGRPHCKSRDARTMNPPQTFPDLRAWPPAFRHEGERVFACPGVIERHKVREARGLALSVDMIDPVKFHAAPLSQLVRGTESNRQQEPRSIPPRCDTRTKVPGENGWASSSFSQKRPDVAAPTRNGHSAVLARFPRLNPTLIGAHAEELVKYFRLFSFLGDSNHDYCFAFP